ncbi:LuxR C-terminal-related transcriptional regulator [Desulfovibrio sp. OttesenSCG-928-M16]|nr:LuxR C-terminal-related transcriptional regulator [Desulfovibrio sp. OttesenSCG-928-M16]
MIAILKDALRSLKKQEKTSLDLGKRLQYYLLFFVVTIFSIVVLFIIIFDIFSPQETAKSLFTFQMQRYEHKLERYFTDIAAQGIHFSRQVAKEIEKTLVGKKGTFDDVSDSQELIAEIENNTYSLLFDSLRIASCSGSFIILDATVNTKLPNSHNSRAGTYLKLANVNTPKPVNPAVLWTRGIHDIGHNNGHIFHNKWQLEFDVSRIPFYRDVIENATKSLRDSYYYSPAFNLHGTWEKIMILCVPIVGKSGRVYGICGFEINSIFFKLLHAEAGSRHKHVIGLVAQKQGDAVLLDSGLEFGTTDGYWAGLGNGLLTARKSGVLTHYRLSGPQGGVDRKFIGMDTPIDLSPMTSPQNSSPWVTVCMIPKEDYDSLIWLSYFKLALFCASFFAIAFVLTYYISKRYNLPILQSIDAIKGGSLHKTNITEIDDLLEYLARNDTAQDVNMSAFIEFKKNIKKLSRAETAVFNLYMEGYSAQKIADTLYVSINTIKSHNKNIYRKLHVSSRKELMVYAQMMRTSDQTEQ